MNRIIDLTATVRRPLLAGAAAGNADRKALESAAEAAAPEDVLVLDLASAEVMTSSYFLAALWPLLDPARPRCASVLLANVDVEVVPDVELALEHKKFPVWTVTLRSGELCESRVLGPLSDDLRSALSWIQEHGPADAGTLAVVDRSIGSTAWSNRLAALHLLRLLRRWKDGRKLMYALPWMEKTNG